MARSAGVTVRTSSTTTLCTVFLATDRSVEIAYRNTTWWNEVIDLFEVSLNQLNIHCGKVVNDLFIGSRANDGGGNAGLSRAPCKRQL